MLKFDHDAHSYRWNGKITPSVTQLIRDYGLIDLSRVPKDVLEFKRVLGTAVHLACELLDENDLDESSIDERIVPYLEGYRKFREIYNFRVQENEMRMYSKKYDFAGTPDRVGIIQYQHRDSRAIIDLKTTWEIYPSNAIQTAGYQILVEENTKEKINKRFALQLKPSGSFELYEYSDPNDKNIFLYCRAIHSWRQKHKLLDEPKEKIKIAKINESV